MKTTAPQSVRKFREIGIDIKKAIADGFKVGRSPLETVILETRKALANNKGLTVGDLFQDQQAQLALAKLVEKYEEFIKIRDEAMKAEGTIARDFQAMSETTKAAFDRMDAAIDRRKKIWSKMLEPIEQWRAGAFERLNAWLAEMPTRFPRLASGAGAFAVAMADILSVAGSLGPALLGVASSLAILKLAGITSALAGLSRLLARSLGFVFFWALRFPAAILAGVMQGFAQGLAPLAAVLGPILLRVLSGIFRILAGPVGWALLAAQIAWIFRAQLMQAFEWLRGLGGQLLDYLRNVDFSTLGTMLANGLTAALMLPGQIGTKIGAALLSALQPAGQSVLEWATDLGNQLVTHITDTASRLLSTLKSAALTIVDFTDVGTKIMQSLLAGLQASAQNVIGWVTGFVGRLKSLFSFSASPSLTPQVAPGAPAATPQSAPGNLTPAPALRNASVTYHNTFNVNGDDPEIAARRIVAALDRQRQASLYDGALA